MALNKGLLLPPPWQTLSTQSSASSVALGTRSPANLLYKEFGGSFALGRKGPPKPGFTTSVAAKALRPSRRPKLRRRRSASRLSQPGGDATRRKRPLPRMGAENPSAERAGHVVLHTLPRPTPLPL